MLAYHGDPKIKAKYLKRVNAHFKADEIIQGATGQDGKGCAVWCTLNKYEHQAYEVELGIPILLARLEDGIFEGLSVKESKIWPAKFLCAIKPGADLSKVGPKFLIWLLEDIIQYAKSAGKIAIQDVINLYKKQLNGENITSIQWSAVRSTAYAAATDAVTYASAYAAAAAYAITAATAAYAADAAAYAAYTSTTSATYAADAAAKQKARGKQAKKLLELLRECK
jgi:hypothetical protein